MVGSETVDDVLSDSPEPGAPLRRLRARVRSVDHGFARVRDVVACGSFGEAGHEEPT